LSHTSLGAKLAALPSPTHSIIASFPKATVLYTFAATKEDELSIEEGDVVHVTGQVDEDGWIKVRRTDGKQGLVPSNYLDLKEVAESLKSARSIKDSVHSSLERSGSGVEKRGSITEMRNNILEKPESVAAKRDSVTTSVTEKLISDHDKAIGEKGNKKFSENDSFHDTVATKHVASQSVVQDTIQSTAVHSASHSHTGVFTPAFISSADKDEESIDREEAFENEGIGQGNHDGSQDIVHVHAASSHEPSFEQYGSHSRSDTNMQSLSHLQEREEVAHLAEPHPTSYTVTSETPPAEATVLFTTTVLYDYIAQEDDELSILEGQSIDVLYIASDGWCLARTASKAAGHVPLNYLTPLDNEPNSGYESSLVYNSTTPVEDVEVSVQSNPVSNDLETEEQSEGLRHEVEPSEDSPGVEEPSEESPVDALEARLAKLRHNQA